MVFDRTCFESAWTAMVQVPKMEDEAQYEPPADKNAFRMPVSSVIRSNIVIGAEEADGDGDAGGLTPRSSSKSCEYI